MYVAQAGPKSCTTTVLWDRESQKSSCLISCELAAHTFATLGVSRGFWDLLWVLTVGRQAIFLLSLPKSPPAHLTPGTSHFTTALQRKRVFSQPHILLEGPDRAIMEFETSLPQQHIHRCISV